MILFDIGDHLIVARDYNKFKDELEETNDEIQLLWEELELAKGLISCQKSACHNFFSNYSKAVSS
jgi:hypothetical protein